MKEQLDHLLNKINRVTAYHRHGQKVSKKDLDALSNAQIEFEEVYKQVSVEPEVKPACERKLIISIENDTVLFDNLNDFKPLEFMGILHNAVSTADVLYKTKVMQMVEKASKSV